MKQKKGSKGKATLGGSTRLKIDEISPHHIIAGQFLIDREVIRLTDDFSSKPQAQTPHVLLTTFFLQL